MSFLDDRMPARFWAKVQICSVSGCWLWVGGLTHDGYGKYCHNGRSALAHRTAYESLTGAVPEGLQLDHLCRNRGCVNPAHLEPVTRRENQMRGVAFVVENAGKTHCVRGHEFNEENTRMWRGHRHCRSCGVIRSRESDARRKRRVAETLDARGVGKERA